MFSQWRSDRQNKTLTGLACFQSNFPSNQIDIIPGEPGKISKPLSCVETKENQAFPFIVCYFQYAPNLGDSERATEILAILPDRLNKFCRILENVSVSQPAFRSHIASPPQFLAASLRPFVPF